MNDTKNVIEEGERDQFLIQLTRLLSSYAVFLSLYKQEETQTIIINKKSILQDLYGIEWMFLI